jgi:hypothetical protein
MNPDDTVRVDKSREEPGLAGTVSEQTRHNQSDTAGHEADSAQPAAEPMGWSERLRQIMQRPAQGQARTNIKRQQLREDRTKAFLMLAGSTVVLGLMFFALFSSPSSSHKDNSARPNRPNLGRGPGGEGADTSRSVTPLLNADTRNPNEDAGKLNPQDIQHRESKDVGGDERAAVVTHAATHRDVTTKRLRSESDSVPGRARTGGSASGSSGWAED